MNTTKKDQIDVPRVVPRTGTTGISIHRIGLPPLTRRVVPLVRGCPCDVPPCPPSQAGRPGNRGVSPPHAPARCRCCGQAEVAKSCLSLSGTMACNQGDFIGLRSDIAAGNVPGVPFHHTAAAPALRDLRHGRHNTVRVRARIVVDHVVGDRRPPSRLFYRGCPSPTSAAPAGEAPNRGR